MVFPQPLGPNKPYLRKICFNYVGLIFVKIFFRRDLHMTFTYVYLQIVKDVEFSRVENIACFIGLYEVFGPQCVSIRMVMMMVIGAV